MQQLIRTQKIQKHNLKSTIHISVEEGKKVYFASDFHLGVTRAGTEEREARVVRWLESIAEDAQAIFLVGDVFDFWFEYKFVIPKEGFLFQRSLHMLRQKGVAIYIFCGNHDLWYGDYFPEHFGIPVFKEPQHLNIDGKNIYIAHGDGLGDGDYFYKFMKKVLFTNPIMHYLAKAMPSNLFFSLAHAWSVSSSKKAFTGFVSKEKELLYRYALSLSKTENYDYYVFGHRHIYMDLPLNNKARYINLGEWIDKPSYGCFENGKLQIHHFEKKY